VLSYDGAILLLQCQPWTARARHSPHQQHLQPPLLPAQQRGNLPRPTAAAAVAVLERPFPQWCDTGRVSGGGGLALN
jgi:hypothetical protein